MADVLCKGGVVKHSPKAVLHQVLCIDKAEAIQLVLQGPVPQAVHNHGPHRRVARCQHGSATGHGPVVHSSIQSPHALQAPPASSVAALSRDAELHTHHDLDACRMQRLDDSLQLCSSCKRAPLCELWVWCHEGQGAAPIGPHAWTTQAARTQKYTRHATIDQLLDSVQDAQVLALPLQGDHLLSFRARCEGGYVQLHPHRLLQGACTPEVLEPRHQRDMHTLPVEVLHKRRQGCQHHWPRQVELGRHLCCIGVC
mmetsp:Transcript_23527/g.64856  ORF Transcript_23527/g.64856 Transcript_23527/m.64856 type:complete len:255 (+) Transcript_23527:546-1310(+)